MVKNPTVTGIIENTQGVITANNPPPKEAKKIHHNDFLAVVFSPSFISPAAAEAPSLLVISASKGISPEGKSSPFFNK